MKYLGSIYTLIAILTFFLLPQSALADSSTSVNISNNGDSSQNNVNVQNSTGGNTICQNGNCTTTGGNTGQSTVCINGNCTTSSGDIDMQSNDGNDQVNISNNTSGNSITVPPTPTATATPVPSPSVSPSPTVSVSPVPL